MPIEINEVNSTVEVEPSQEGSGQQPLTPLMQTVQRWLELARRQEEITQRVRAWQFDD